MQEKPPFSSYFDFFFPNVWEGDTPLPHPPPAYFDFALRHAPGSKSDSAPHNKMAARFEKKKLL